MPNWCQCKLTIKGPAEQLLSFRDGIRRSADGSYLHILASYYPMPQAFEGISTGFASLADGRRVTIWREEPRGAGDTHPMILEVSGEEQKMLMRSYGATNWHDWCRTFWGSKWGDCHTQLSRDMVTGIPSDSLIYRFDAAWCCPCKGFAEVSKQFPLLFFLTDYRE